MKKFFISVILIIALVLTLTMNVFAAVLESSVTINNITDKQIGDTFNITGTSTSNKVLIRIQNHDGDIIGSNVVNVNANQFSSAFKVPANKGTGLFTVLANNEDGSASTSTTFNVSTGTPVTSIPVTTIVVSSDRDKISVLNGGTLQMSAVVLPDTATNKAFTWSVANGTGSATINASGLLTATAVGDVTVKATASDGSGIVGTKSLTVTSIPVTSIAVTSVGDSVIYGNTLQMSATVLPDTATNKTVEWSVTNGTGSATINASGLLTATAAGTIIVKATANDGSGVTGTKSITVTVPSPTGGGPAGGSPAGGITGGTGTTTTVPAASQIQAIVNPQGSAAAQVGLDGLKSAIANAANGTAKIEVTGSSNAKDIQVTLPAQQLFAADAAKVDMLEVNAGLAQISIKKDLLKNANGSVPANVNITITKVDSNSLTSNVKSKVGNNQVYDFSLSADGDKISSFKNNEVKVKIKYALKQGENPNNVVIYYISDSGALEVVTNGKYSTDTGLVEFAPNHFSKYAAVYVSATYKDIVSVPWAKESIEALAARGIIGNAGGTFNPSANITRADFLDMVIKASNLVDNSAVCTFKDVDKKASYYQTIATAQKLGIVLGTGKGSFEPNTFISRQDMAVMLYRIASKANMDISGVKNAGAISDKSSISSYAVDAVSAMYKTGLLNGTGNGVFAPKSTTTRAQGAVVAFNMFQRIK